jgi:hypothetical protein
MITAVNNENAPTPKIRCHADGSSLTRAVGDDFGMSLRKIGRTTLIKIPRTTYEYIVHGKPGLGFIFAASL